MFVWDSFSGFLRDWTHKSECLDFMEMVFIGKTPFYRLTSTVFSYYILWQRVTTGICLPHTTLLCTENRSVSCRLGHSSKVGNSHTQTDGDDARQMHGPCCAYCAGIANNNFSVSTQRSSHQRTFGTRGFRKLLYGLILINLWVPTNIT